MNKLRIGVTPSAVKDSPGEVRVTANMVHAVEASGAEVVTLYYPMDKSVIDATLPTLDGLIMAGGPDVHPRHFGQEPDPNLGVVTEERDELELYVMKWAMETDIPVLGVCRGCQLINVALGGTLHQDLVHNQHMIHRQGEGIRYWHDVVFEGPSVLRSLVPSDRYPTNSFHHQAVDRPADGLVVTAYSANGVIEAFERPASRFLMGVQWHPESSFDADFLSREIFRVFLDACRAWREKE